MIIETIKPVGSESVEVTDLGQSIELTRLTGNTALKAIYDTHDDIATYEANISNTDYTLLAKTVFTLTGPVYPSGAYGPLLETDRLRAERDISRAEVRVEKAGRILSELHSSHDPKTGALNALGFGTKMRESISRDSMSSDANDTGTLILEIDLDGFKGVNDEHGHDAGDEVLKHVPNEVVKCMEDTMRIANDRDDPDLVGRIGGDEFRALLRKIPISYAPFIVDRIRKQLDTVTIEYEGEYHTVGLSVGAILVHNGTIELVSKGGESNGLVLSQESEKLILKQADSAMYEEKNRRKSLKQPRNSIVKKILNVFSRKTEPTTR